MVEPVSIKQYIGMSCKRDLTNIPSWLVFNWNKMGPVSFCIAEGWPTLLAFSSFSGLFIVDLLVSLGCFFNYRLPLAWFIAFFLSHSLFSTFTNIVTWFMPILTFKLWIRLYMYVILYFVGFLGRTLVPTLGRLLLTLKASYLTVMHYLYYLCVALALTMQVLRHFQPVCTLHTLRYLFT